MFSNVLANGFERSARSGKGGHESEVSEEGHSVEPLECSVDLCVWLL